MSRTFSIFSGHHHHHHRPTSSSTSPSSIAGDRYSKSDKSRKPLHYRTPKTLFFLLSAICILVGISGISFYIFILVNPLEIQTFRCGRVEDTFRSKLAGRDIIVGAISSRPKLLGFVGIQTGFASRDRRDALRSTWFPSDTEGLLRLERSTGLAFRFVIGRAKLANKMAELEKEINKYNDFLLIDVEEEYLKLTYKTLAYFKAAFKLFDAEYYVKADDDIYLRPVTTATTAELFESTMNSVKEASTSFTTLLLSLRRSVHWDIAAAVRSIESATAGGTITTTTSPMDSIVGSNHAKYALESFLKRLRHSL